ncbi:TPA: hypothetical protein HA235_01835 [Candidatus Woesearchaeota archaeon]|nr:hypothetical protein [Candidatus Woesearchaeota archaeon]HIH31425.1 hypothetical protein [Candidatus Woesearchaeota archaeon]HIH55314.1 hypothetical protein [Candidatus Woesearchaeota archaeon]HIJ01291.1 hypothetical protein [Candidatus Woesearchaeota archaeon]HIJ13697.1 hypothetical protein [Candidatus Woesearchaeota archaeon]
MDCPSCKEGFLERIEDGEDMRLFKCGNCNNIILKEYELIDVKIFGNPKPCVEENELVLGYKLLNSKKYMQAARKGLFSLRDFWVN